MKEYKPLIVIAICSLVVTFLVTFIEPELDQDSITTVERISVILLPAAILFGIICGFYFPIHYFIERSKQKRSGVF
jgi:hypothetical protein